MSGESDLPNAKAMALLRETYRPEGVDIWLRQWVRSDEAERGRMLLHLTIGADGGCS